MLTSSEIRRENLNKLIKKAKGQASLSEKISLSPSQVSSIITKRKGMGNDIARKIERKLGLPGGFMDNIQGKITINPSRENINIPIYDISANAGSGSIVFESGTESNMSINKKLFQHVTGINPDKINDIGFINIDGDSMSPTLKSNSLVLVERISAKNGDGIYVFYNSNDELQVKRLQTINNITHVISDNNAYINYKLQEDINIVGKILTVIDWRKI